MPLSCVALKGLCIARYGRARLRTRKCMKFVFNPKNWILNGRRHDNSIVYDFYVVVALFLNYLI